jgi:hypothetical protein
MSAFEGKADMKKVAMRFPLLTHCGHWQVAQQPLPDVIPFRF